jgi:anti-sigma B factor antagonist
MKLSITELSLTSAVIKFASDNLDSSNVKAFRDQILEPTKKYETLLLDMDALNFVDSSGLGALLSTLRIMNNKDGQLRLFGMTRPVRALFELVRMHRIFLIFANQEEALAQAPTIK